MKLLAADDLAEGDAPIERFRPALLAYGLLWTILAVAGRFWCNGFECFERKIKIEFIVEVLGADDFAELRRVLSVPRPRPPDRMAGRDVGGVASNQLGGDAPRALELCDVGTPRGFFQPPMGVQFVLDFSRCRIH